MLIIKLIKGLLICCVRERTIHENEKKNVILYERNKKINFDAIFDNNKISDSKDNFFIPELCQ